MWATLPTFLKRNTSLLKQLAAMSQPNGTMHRQQMLYINVVSNVDVKFHIVSK